jgi:hypothetical protein
MGLFRRLLGRETAADNADEQETREIVERMVKLSPQLRLATQYQKRLAQAVGTSLAYVGELVNALPGAHEACASAWSTDPVIHAFFATPDDVAEALSRSANLRAHFEQNPLAREAFGVLGMTMTERRVLGTVQKGDTLLSDVAQTTVSFSDHQVRVCGATEAELRQEIVRRVLDQLTLEGIAKIEDDASRRDLLQRERALLKARLQLLERQGAGMGAVLGSGATVDFAELAHLQAEIDENDRHLADLGSQTDALDRQLETIRDVLAEPALHLFVATRKLRLNRMNVIAEDTAADDGAEIEFRVARIPASPAGMRAFSLVRFARADLLPAPSLDDAAKRLI